MTVTYKSDGMEITISDEEAARRYPPIEVPQIDPLKMSLQAWRIHAMLRILGFEKVEVMAAIAKVMSDPSKRIAAEELYQGFTQTERNSPLFNLLGPVLKLDADALDAAWIEAYYMDLGI